METKEKRKEKKRMDTEQYNILQGSMKINHHGYNTSKWTLEFTSFLACLPQFSKQHPPGRLIGFYKTAREQKTKEERNQ